MAKVGRLGKDSVVATSRTTDGIAYTGAVLLHGVALFGGSTTPNVIVHDSLDTGGARTAVVNTAVNTTTSVMFPKPVLMSTGIYTNISGTGSEVVVYYEVID